MRSTCQAIKIDTLQCSSASPYRVDVFEKCFRAIEANGSGVAECCTKEIGTDELRADCTDPVSWSLNFSQ